MLRKKQVNYKSGSGNKILARAVSNENGEKPCLTYFPVSGCPISCVFLMGVVFICCSSFDQGIVNPTWNGNRITNPTFELNGMPSIYGWTLRDADSSDMAIALYFSNDIPSGERGYSVVIRNLPFVGPERISQTVPAIPGTHVYAFSIWSKSTTPLRSNIWGGGFGFGLKKPDTTIAMFTSTVFDSIWERRVFADTINALSGDSLVVALRGGYESLPSKVPTVFFSSCEIKVIR